MRKEKRKMIGEKMSLIDRLDEEIAKERERCKCDEKMIVDEDFFLGGKICGPGCVGCRHYHPDEMRCDIRDNVARELEEEDAYNDTVGRDHE